MRQKFPLLAGTIAGLAFVLASLTAADTPAPAAASGSGTAAAKPAADSGSAKPAAASGSSSASAPTRGRGPAKPDLSKLPKPSDKKDLTFDKDIAPMLKASCADCHGDVKPKQGFSILTRESILKGGRAGKEVVPGHSDESLVVLYASDAVARSEMPPLRNRTGPNAIHPLTKEQIADLRAWIDSGAK
jgi:mono/diheme cytochrome c family protein